MIDPEIPRACPLDLRGETISSRFARTVQNLFYEPRPKEPNEKSVPLSDSPAAALPWRLRIEAEESDLFGDDHIATGRKIWGTGSERGIRKWQ